ncbi:MAG TPA: hypothetical protein VKZ87_08500 [Ferrovibrio sp.]|uniref:hypothetical protein n=1 Tax=Ferrovibrio sp. TaxID=1917215 RepID=UPI002B4B0B7F|nr:hypothetical protein [Ferrovibrio sp.]HLT77412.1 hypothetical protein [Ferrovibrio sp.]
MTHTTPVPYKDTFPDGAAPPKARHRVDWKQAAQRLAAGEPGGQVAAALGISEDRLWRHFDRSARFRFLFRRALERSRLSARLAFENAAREAVVQRGGRVAEIDGESWQWLARQTGLAPDVDPDGQGGSGNALAARDAQLITELKEAAGRQPPNMAEFRRLQKEGRRMNAEFAALKAWARSYGILPPAPGEESATAPASPAATVASHAETQTGKNDDEGRAGADKDGISENKTPISANPTPSSTELRSVAVTAANHGNGTGDPPSGRAHPHSSIRSHG